MSEKKIVIPASSAKEYIEDKFNEYMTEDDLVSKEFWDYFTDKRPTYQLQVPSLLDWVNLHVEYDDDNKFDLRLLLTMVHPDDKPLFIDVCKFTVERYQSKPASILTLTQFKADLTRRLASVGF